MRIQMAAAVLWCSALALAAGGTALGQVGLAPSFEVASVRLTGPSTRASERVTNSRVDLTRITLRQLLWMAFRIDPFHSADRLSAPDWVANVIVDVHATIPAGGSREQVPDMVRRLLIERFGLRTHVESRSGESYELVVGAGSLQVQEAQPANDLETKFTVDSSSKTVLRDNTVETVGGSVRTVAVPMGTRTITERSMYEETFTDRRTVQLTATRISMPEFASLLARNLGRPVVDRTGLEGVYRLKLELPPASFVAAGLAAIGRTQTAGGLPLNEPTGLSTIRAVEQLGLKLEPRRILMDAMIVDAIDRSPREN